MQAGKGSKASGGKGKQCEQEREAMQLEGVDRQSACVMGPPSHLNILPFFSFLRVRLCPDSRVGTWTPLARAAEEGTGEATMWNWRMDCREDDGGKGADRSEGGREVSALRESDNGGADGDKGMCSRVSDCVSNCWGAIMLASV